MSVIDWFIGSLGLLALCGCVTIWCHLLYTMCHLVYMCNAVEEAIIALVRLYQRYTFELSEELLAGPLEVKQGITMSPKHGVPVKVIRRTNVASNTA